MDNMMDKTPCVINMDELWGCLDMGYTPKNCYFIGNNADKQWVLGFGVAYFRTNPYDYYGDVRSDLNSDLPSGNLT